MFSFDARLRKIFSNISGLPAPFLLNFRSFENDIILQSGESGMDPNFFQKFLLACKEEGREEEREKKRAQEPR